jgi:hypothetical protein
MYKFVDMSINICTYNTYIHLFIYIFIYIYIHIHTHIFLYIYIILPTYTSTHSDVKGGWTVALSKFILSDRLTGR